MDLPSEHLFGCDFVSGPDIDEVADRLLDDACRSPRTWRCTVTPNVDHLVRYSRNPLERGVSRDATTLLPDGMPIVWASRLLGIPLRRRLAGSDLFSALWPRISEGSIPVVVLASGEEVARGLRSEHPGAVVMVAPVFDTQDGPAVASVVAGIDEAVRSSGARFVFVGVSMPKHHLIAHELKKRWGSRRSFPHVMLLGASADLYVGVTRRAPEWMQRCGLEWLHRLASDPRRLARRYLLEDPWFAVLLWREWRGRERA